MISLKTPRGLPVEVPETLDDDPSPRFTLADSAAARAYYEANGYVIFRDLFSQPTCDEMRGLWDREIKPYKGYIYRQATARAETHVKNANGWIMNPILNLQSVDPRHSRSSITCHAIPKSRKFLQLQTRVLSIKKRAILYFVKRKALPA